MLTIRFSRAGRKKVPFFRIVLTEHKKSATHGYMKVLGYYSPLTKDLKIDQEEAKKYIQNGAQFSDSLQKVLKKKDIIINNK